MRIEGGHTVAEASTGLLDKLPYCVDDRRPTKSNTLVNRLSVAGARWGIDRHHRRDGGASSGGRFRTALRTQRGCCVRRTVPADRPRQTCRGRRHGPDGDVFAAARIRLLQELRRGVTRHSTSCARQPSTTVAGGMRSVVHDAVVRARSSAVACLARQIGGTERFTIRPDATRKGWVALANAASLADGQYFRVPSRWDSEPTFRDLASLIADSGGMAAVFTGCHGDKVLDVATAGRHLADDMLRGDTSGRNLSEIRLASGLSDVAVPFLFARNVRARVGVPRSAARYPWRPGDDGVRPILRRIVGKAGAPRSLVGTNHGLRRHRRAAEPDAAARPRSEASHDGVAGARAGCAHPRMCRSGRARAFVLTGAARHRSYRWGFGPPTRPPDDRRHCRGGSVVLAGKGR